MTEKEYEDLAISLYNKTIKYIDTANAVLALVVIILQSLIADEQMVFITHTEKIGTKEVLFRRVQFYDISSD